MSIVQAPPGCAQWFNSRTGNISSLNLQDGQYQVRCTYTTHITYTTYTTHTTYTVYTCRLD